MPRNRIAILILCYALVVGISTPSLLASGSQENEQPAVTWQTFRDRNNLFTAQYPSNWTPSAVAAADRTDGPIDILFLAPITGEDEVGQVEFIQYSEPSIYSTAQESLQAEINGLQSDPTLTKFQIERPIECQKYTLAGLQACSYIYEIRSPDGNLAAMAVDALSTNGTEYEAYYQASFDLFEHFLPAAENMINSFQLTADNVASDFSLGDEGSTSNNATATSSSPMNEDFSLNDTTTSTNTTQNGSNDGDFSLN